MYIDLMKTLRKIEKLLPEDEVQDAAQLEKAYALTLRLHSQLIAVRYDIEQFGMAAVICTRLIYLAAVGAGKKRK